MNELIVNGTLLPDTTAKLIKLRENLKALEEAKKEIESQILSAMESQFIKKIENDDISITYVGESDVESFDKTAFRKAHPDLYDEFITMKARAPYLIIKVK